MHLAKQGNNHFNARQALIGHLRHLLLLWLSCFLTTLVYSQTIGNQQSVILEKPAKTKQDTLVYRKTLSLGLGFGNLLKLPLMYSTLSERESFIVYDVNLRQTLMPKLALQVEYLRYAEKRFDGFTRRNDRNYKVNSYKFKCLFNYPGANHSAEFYEYGFVALFNHSKQNNSFLVYDFTGLEVVKKEERTARVMGIGFHFSKNLVSKALMVKLEVEAGKLILGDTKQVPYVVPGIGMNGYFYFNADIEFYFPLYKFKKAKEPIN